MRERPADPGGMRRAPGSGVLAGRVLAGVCTAIVLALSFPPYDLLEGWAAVPAFAALVAAHRGLTARLGALVGVASGMAFFLVLLVWLRVLGPDAWIALSFVCALFWVATGCVLPWLLRQRWWVLLVPLAWTVQEALRERIPWGGFPWGRLGFAQAGTSLVGWAALGGAALVTFVVALASTLLLAGADAARVRRPLAVAACAGAIVGLAAAGGQIRGAGWGGTDGAAQPIAVVQGNVPRVGLDFNAQRRAVLDNHVRVTEELAAQVAAGTYPQPVAVMWPENSSDIDPLRNRDAAEQIDRAARSISAPILVGAVLRNPADDTTLLNVGLVWDPVTGPGEGYVKRHPVPFGEYLPFRDVLTRFITRFERVPRDFAPGSQPGLVTIGPVPAGVVICFETAYDSLVRDAVRAGGQVLVVQTNNATYGLTGQPEQQLAISRVQSVASGRTTLVAATSGISAVVSPDGSLRWRTEQFVPASTVADVPMRSGFTPAMRLGSRVELGAVLALLALVVASRRRRGSARVSDAPGSTVAPGPPVPGTGRGDAVPGQA
jgi:apolipoprotein N-acyltransferase